MSTNEDITMISRTINGEPKTIEWTEEDNEVEPTAAESSMYEHISDRIPLSAWLIVVCELCERFAFYGLSGPFQNYIQFPEPGPNDKQSGALGRGQQTATALTTYFQFFAYLTPIAGAILADQFWGKYKTIIVACVIYLIGLLVLVLTSIPSSIHAGVAFPGLIVAMTIIGLGTGSVKSNVSPLMVEQYTRTKSVVKEINGKKKIIDPKLTVQSMFNWFYWAINIGAMSTIATTNTEKYHSFWLAYLVPLVVFTGSIIVLIIGRKRYTLAPPTGSLLLRAARVIIKAIRMQSKLGKKANRTHLLDYAKEIPPSPINQNEQKTIKRLNENQFIDDLKKAVRACRVFLFYPFYWICYNQLGTNLISQAAQMNVGPLPNDVLQNIDLLVLIVFIPIFDKMIYPTLRRFKINFSSIVRITCGFFCVSIAMAWAAFVQHRIYSTEPNFDYTNPCDSCQKFNNIVVAGQIPTYFFIAISEIFASITGVEYAFTQAPASMKSIVTSLFLFTTAIGSVLNFTLVPVTVNPKLLWMYTSLSIMSFTVGILFFLVFRNEQKVRVAPLSNQ